MVEWQWPQGGAQNVSLRDRYQYVHRKQPLMLGDVAVRRMQAEEVMSAHTSMSGYTGQTSPTFGITDTVPKPKSAASI